MSFMDSPTAFIRKEIVDALDEAQDSGDTVEVHPRAASPRGAAWVAVEMGGEPLETFTHPDRAVYFLGADGSATTWRHARSTNTVRSKAAAPTIVTSAATSCSSDRRHGLHTGTGPLVEM